MNTKNPNLKVVFLNKLTDLSDQVTYKTLAKIDKDLNVTHDLNPEIGQRWYPLAIQEDFQDAFPAIKHYVQTIGRQKYILPVYSALVQNGYRNLAYQWFNERKNFYHPLTVKKIRAIIFSSKMGMPEKEYLTSSERAFLQ